jgi:hypothetical protein
MWLSCGMIGLLSFLDFSDDNFFVKLLHGQSDIERVLKNKKAGQTLKVFSAILSQKLPILPSFCDFMPCLETFRVFFNTLIEQLARW